IVDNSEVEDVLKLETRKLKRRTSRQQLATRNTKPDPVNPIKKEETISQRSPRSLRLKENSKSEINEEEKTKSVNVSPAVTDNKLLKTNELNNSDEKVERNLQSSLFNRKSVLLASLAPVSINDAPELVPENRKLVTGNSKLDPAHPVKEEKENQRSPRPLRLKENRKCSGVDPQYTYDLNGNRASMITPYGTFTYIYDALDRLTSITNPNNEITSFTYDEISRRDTVTYDNGVVTSFTYDAASRLTDT
ncbi:MAG: RHS repeat protein, partial [Planctomycetes bacterium]|nr:RHS repeat protein [Planctomycetota bacterium]